MVTWDELPKEIQEKMLERQAEQDNRRSAGVFREDISANEYKGGFRWYLTSEGEDFWSEILENDNIDHFYTLYPKQESTKGALNELHKQAHEYAEKQKRDLELQWYTTKPNDINHEKTNNMTKFIDRTKKGTDKVFNKTVFYRRIYDNGQAMGATTSESYYWNKVELIARLKEYDLLKAHFENTSIKAIFTGKAGDEFQGVETKIGDTTYIDRNWKPKEIENKTVFRYFLREDGKEIFKSNDTPSQYKYVELITRTPEYDTLKAYDSDTSRAVIYLGKAGDEFN